LGKEKFHFDCSEIITTPTHSATIRGGFSEWPRPEPPSADTMIALCGRKHDGELLSSTSHQHIIRFQRNDNVMISMCAKNRVNRKQRCAYSLHTRWLWRLKIHDKAILRRRGDSRGSRREPILRMYPHGGRQNVLPSCALDI